MSHFTVLVSAKDEKQLEAKLLPYHEYECTGIEAYLEFCPGDPEEMKTEYEDHKENYPDFDAFAQDWYGYKKNDAGVYGRMTNPNAKWDWWQIGGRWTGALRLKRNRVLVSDAGNGNPGLMTPANIDHKYADYAPAGEVDWDGMIADWRGKQRAWWAKHNVYLELARQGEPSREATEKANALWNEDGRRGELAHQTFKALDTAILYEQAEYLAHKDNQHWFYDWDEISKILMSQEEFEHTLEKAHAITYAYIDLQGKWQQRGEMGWFGMDDKSKGTIDYDLVWWEFVRSIPDDLMVYVVDCHI